MWFWSRARAAAALELCAGDNAVAGRGPAWPLSEDRWWQVGWVGHAAVSSLWFRLSILFSKADKASSHKLYFM